MSPTGIPKIRGPRRGAQALTGVEKCPRCGALQDLKDRVTTAGLADTLVSFWACHVCGHTWRVWRDQVLEPDWWPAKRRDGTYGLVKVTVAQRAGGIQLSMKER